MKQKLKYLLRSALHFRSPISCPNCGSDRVDMRDRKFFFTRLFECAQCHLQFRHPVDSTGFSKAFYQLDYFQDDGITTDLPSSAELNALLASGFKNSNKHVGRVMALWRSLGHHSQVKAVDYGCSWGYMTYQFKELGVLIQGFEVSRPRAEFGNKFLGLNIQTDSRYLKTGNDIVYSSHVIEHVPSIPDMLAEGKRLLNSDGMFIAESPNGSPGFRMSNFTAFHQGWGLVHPNYLSDLFYQSMFRENPYYITSTPYDLEAIGRWDGKSQVTDRTAGSQLLVIAKPNQRV